MHSLVVLINLFEVPREEKEIFIRWWREASNQLQQEPGFIDAQLHQNLSEEAHFTFVNIAHWEREEHLQAARARHTALLQAPVGRGNPSLYKTIMRYPEQLTIST